ncbi:MAG: sugar phosphate isomerase/epimerase family protein [Planctomycetota bacterium]
MKYAICNELYEGWNFGDVCRSVAGIGYTSLEVAPFTLAPLVTDISTETRKTLRKQAEDAGLQILGLHWLLAKTTGFHLNSPEESVRRRTAEYLAEQVRCCADLGGELMVFGSPPARKILPGVTMDEAMEYAADTLRKITAVLAERKVRFCIEPLAPAETDFLQTADEGTRLMRMIDHPNVVLHLDVKAMSSESQPIPEIIAKHVSHTGHFHANDPNMRGPGMGKVDFHPIFQALKDNHYKGWVSVEVFDFKPDPETIARESLEYMRRCEAELH